MGSASAGVGSALPSQDGFSGYVLTTDGVVASWEPSSASLPSQVGNSGKYLTTNGTAAAWGAVTADGLLPAQSGKSGYFLSSNGTTVSWSNSPTGLLPTQTGNSGKVLSTDGAGTLSWIDAAGLALGAFGSAPDAKGMSLSAGTLTAQPADLTHPGFLSIGAQTFAGVKTFDSVPVAAGISAPTTSGFTLAGNVTTGGSAVGVTIDNLVALTTAGAKIVSFTNASVEKASIDKDGVIVGSKAAFGTWTVSDTGFFGSPAVHCTGGCAFTGAGEVHFGTEANSAVNIRQNGATAATFTAGILDLTGLGTGGAIKLKDDAGATKTCTISGGVWVIS